MLIFTKVRLGEETLFGSESERDDLLLRYHETGRRKAAWYRFAENVNVGLPERELRKQYAVVRLRSELLEYIGEAYMLYTQQSHVLGPTWSAMFLNQIEAIYSIIND